MILSINGHLSLLLPFLEKPQGLIDCKNKKNNLISPLIDRAVRLAVSEHIHKPGSSEKIYL